MKKIDKIFFEFNENTPGAAVAVFKDGEIIFKKGYGLADLNTRSEITGETNFRLASVTKQFTAASVFLLIEDNLINLDSKLVDILPEFPDYANDITIKHLLQHTSGLQDYEDFIPDTASIQLLDHDVVEILIEQDSTYFKPGYEHRYSNSGYAVLAQIVEKISGKSFPEFLKERVFIPADMQNSVAYVNGINDVPDRALGYKKTDDGFEISDQSLTSAVLGDGGIYSSLNDMFKWDQSLYKASVLPQKVLDASWTKGKLNNGENFEYGFGWRLIEYRGYRLDYHTGSTCGFSNVYMRFPELDLGIVVLMNIRDYEALEYGKKVADIFLN
ncbi:MAG: beta-lactamase family protein [Melioribacteraceae bacterium]|nr:beta-lactamase family protein [Melioribacteraceae bacterium]